MPRPNVDALALHLYKTHMSDQQKPIAYGTFDNMPESLKGYYRQQARATLAWAGFEPDAEYYAGKPDHGVTVADKSVPPASLARVADALETQNLIAFVSLGTAKSWHEPTVNRARAQLFDRMGFPSAR